MAMIQPTMAVEDDVMIIIDHVLDAAFSMKEAEFDIKENDLRDWYENQHPSHDRAVWREAVRQYNVARKKAIADLADLIKHASADKVG